ncbi:helix-turn-helix domain-containing protein [Methylocella silvestris]|uniref:GAF domain-containing protein n=1 Tax=Methylocella silvestris TaxID=199596 RepID=A0A2J7TCT8_METSI|nr:GAF domain-containing protein [Methylocella silvestris]PNG24569.1 hypothetical protein CR492_18125 [Methylocella silvestris]
MVASKLDLCAPARRSTPEVGDDPFLALDALTRRVVAAVEGGSHSVFAEAERSLLEFADARAVRILVNAAGSWRPWRQLNMPDAPSRIDPAPEPEISAGSPFLADNRIVAPIRPGSIVALIDHAAIGEVRLKALGVAANCIDLAIATGERQDSSSRNATEMQALQNVAVRILQSSDIEEILLLVSHETKRLLASDICGALMRDGDEVVMRNCVGHFSVEMAKLRMKPGKGVAGRVLATSEPCVVANYVDSDAISPDFIPLARIEKVRSAAAAPILSRDAVIGVLEVWRRRPSTYTEQDTNLLLALAGLASLAIVNAELLQSRASAAAELAVANAALAQRCSTIENSAKFQEKIVQLMLSGRSLAVLAATTAEHVAGTVLVLDRDLAVETAQPDPVESAGPILDVARSIIKKVNRIPDQAIIKGAGADHVLAQPVLAGAELLGWIVWHGEADPSETTRLALSHVSLAVAMLLLERRSAARARAETVQAVLWDLLEGDEMVSAAALDRAREMNVSFRGKVCVLVATLEGFGCGRDGRAGLPDGTTHDRVLDRARLSELGQSAHMVGLRGDQLRMICKAADAESLCATAARMISDIRRETPGLSLKAGISGPCGDLRKLPACFREGTVALEVAQYRRGQPVACYSDIGVLGLLINLRGKTDIRRVSEEILGELTSEPEPSRKILLETMQTFFECDCSQIATAAKLGMHQKTIAYRLGKVSRLTGLNLGRHQDRLLADIGIRLSLTLEAK